MRISAVFGLNQIVSHGFGLFLFAALVPLMRESIAITNWHLAAIGALTQLSYLAGALLLGFIGNKVCSARLVLATGSLTTILLYSMSQLQHPLIITVVLVVLAASAAISWGAIVEIVGRHSKPERCSTYLSFASSGTAWGYGLNGLLILMVVPTLGWQSSWQIAALVGLIVVSLTWRLLTKLNRQPSTHTIPVQAMIPASKLFSTIIRERTALFACVVSLLLGFSTMPFANWLSTYLNELQLPATLGGYTWTIAGVTGMFAGVITGWIADRTSHATALMIIFTGFALSLMAFVYDPTQFAVLAGFGYGLMYFPVWGILAGWIRQSFSSTATMQICSICMVTFGLGGALGNLLAGYIRDATGSLELVYIIVTLTVILMALLTLIIMRTSPSSDSKLSLTV
ncbi:MFS transporter [Colwellia psychrerythraea]|uniref:Putative membrane protein n=1 Tax=Colwellia psychrerythraea (strain 34H / ATCC BAA-681) TaxID=167879 RepID=Q47X00_COLP3|nr:MFS transporter [Colwellia psychrerythraea]AAZ24965.1 putative membrane protein [Colwellia psychrerythraea 34H]